jgi:isopenicillin N synthase-like dioxygenase
MSERKPTPPIISLGGLDGDHAAKARVAEALRATCLDKGFFYIVDHGVPPDLIGEVMAQSRRFFDLAMADKMTCDMSRSECHRGYEPLRGQILEAGAPPDLKEGFYIGEDLARDDPRVVAGLFNHGPNIWPNNLPGWRETMETYYREMVALCRKVMRTLALSLRLPEDHFAGLSRDPVAVLRLLHYPPQPANPAPGEKGCGAHTDFGAITILLQDEVGGLQVFDADHGWIDAPPVPDAFVVNLGDLTARWTNDRYRSTLHRVINSSGRERYSAPFFFEGAPHYDVTCLPTCLDPGERPKYPPTTPIDHLAEMYRQTYARNR